MTASIRTYVYALIHPADVNLEVAGIDGAAVRVVRHPDHEDIGAVVSSVAAELFDPATMEQRLADLVWLEAVVRAHDAVVTAAAGSVTAIPLRLGTTSADDDSVRALLADLAAPARREFDRLENRHEYGVQVFGSPRRRGGSAGEGETGLAFLQRRKAELQRDETAQAAEAAEADAVVTALAADAVDCRRNPPRTGPPGAAEMLVNAVFLVADAHAQVFRERVEQLAESLGAGRVVLTGPWAPYSFAELTL